jgi:hypothetical protein
MDGKKWNIFREDLERRGWLRIDPAPCKTQ